MENIRTKENVEKSTKEFFENNPDLESSKKAILELSKSTGMTPEEVAIHYNFMDNDKTQKRTVKGKFAPKEKSYADLSREEKKAFINQSAGVKPTSFW